MRREVEEPGQYLTFAVGPTSIIVARGQDGELRGFHNSCRHRGFRLCDTDRGQSKTFVCPYHRWTYRLDGSLAYASYMPEDFDKSEHGLRPVHVRTMSGQIFVCMADNPPDFDQIRRAGHADGGAAWARGRQGRASRHA